MYYFKVNFLTEADFYLPFPNQDVRKDLHDDPWKRDSEIWW